MKTVELMKVFTSESKTKIVAHFWNCTCVRVDCVSDLKTKLQINQSNLSKHIAKLLSLQILTYEQFHKKRYYHIDQTFKKTWGQIVDPIVSLKENQPYQCKVCKKDIRV